jgi:hypothetical protein
MKQDSQTKPDHSKRVHICDHGLFICLSRKVNATFADRSVTYGLYL